MFFNELEKNSTISTLSLNDIDYDEKFIATQVFFSDKQSAFCLLSNFFSLGFKIYLYIWV